MLLSLIVPCYNEEKNIRPFYERCADVLQDCSGQTELVFIDDGSRDKTVDELRALCANSAFYVRVVSLSRNFGKDAAILAGMRVAQGEFCAILDADLQQDPAYLIPMLETLQNDPSLDGVAAFQARRKEGRVMRFFKDSFYRLMSRMTKTEFHSGASDFRLLRRNVVDAVLSLPEKSRFSKGIFSWVGFHITYMPYEVNERKRGKSKWGFWRLLRYGIDGLVAFSDKPLIFSSVIGFLLFVISIVMLLVVVIKTILFGDPVAGFPTLASLILLGAGIQLFCLGIIGRYLAKVYEETKNRPVYLVRETFDSDNKK